MKFKEGLTESVSNYAEEPIILLGLDNYPRTN